MHELGLRGMDTKCSHKCPYKREAEGILTEKQQQCDKILLEQAVTAGFEDMRRGQERSHARGVAVEAGRGKTQVFPRSPQGEGGPANTSLLA